MLSIMFSLLVVNNGFQVSYVNMHQIQAIEFVDIEDEGGILTINMRDSEDLTFRCDNLKKWEKTKDSLVKFSYDISKAMDSRTNIVIKEENKDRF
tara:strand:- start:1736 stop:2020 length:285 start_codon:yes stop_codon:yes gene_type:complete